MFPTKTSYYRPTSLSDAIDLLSTREGAKLLAGGHSLIPLMKMRLAAPSALIDIAHIDELDGITANDSGLTIGALTTQARIAESDLVKKQAPILVEAAGMVGDPAVRNRGTLGGNVSHSDPASDIPTVMVSLGATYFTTGSNGERSILASEFATGLLETALHEDEILTRIEIPSIPENSGSAYLKFSHPASRYAVVGVAAIVTISAGICTHASVVVGGVETTPTHASSVEAALLQSDLGDDVLDGASAALTKDFHGDPMSDIFASAEYRQAMAVVYARRALATAISRTS